MIKFLSTQLLNLLGWKSIGVYPTDQKLIVLVAPHTSNYDFFIGGLFILSENIRPSILMKSELFFFPVKYILRALGGIPVDRTKKTNIREQLVNNFSVSDTMTLIITPEGTRRKVTEWKKGFYEIAEKANVPVFLVYLDYQNKVIGLHGYMEMTGNLSQDILQFKQVFHKLQAKRPNKFSLEK